MNKTIQVGQRNKIELLAPVGFRESIIVRVNGKSVADWCTWSRIELTLSRYGVAKIQWYKKLAVWLGFDVGWTVSTWN
jgi:hypothetical protein